MNKLRRLGIHHSLADHSNHSAIEPSRRAFLAADAAGGAALLAGYLDDGSPIGFCFVGGAWQEAKLLGFAFDLEQELGARVPPTYLGAVPPEPPEAGICVGKPKPHGGTGKVDWRSRRML